VPARNVDLKVVGQDLRAVVVKIQNAASGETVGTGVIVSPYGKIVTCAHVVVAAGVNPATGKPTTSTFIDLATRLLGKTPPAAVDGLVGIVVAATKRPYLARVIANFSNSDDDVALLQIVGLKETLPPQHIARLGDAADSSTHSFRTYGYVPLGPYPAVAAMGRIVGLVEGPEDRRLLVDPVQLESQQIDRGMSGAPVLDEDRNLVVGIVAEVWNAADAHRNRDTSWAVNAVALTKTPFGVPLESAPVQRLPGPRPSERTDIRLAVRSAQNATFQWNNASSLSPEWVGRTDLLAMLTNEWRNKYRRVVGLVGFGGEGKSSAARRWMEQLQADDGKDTPRGAFWWSFDQRPAVDEFLQAALVFMSPKAQAESFRSADDRARAIGELLRRGRFIFVFDGLETLQHQSGPEFGVLTNNDLRQVLSYFASGYHNSFCIVTTRVPVMDLMPYSSYSEVQVGRLTIDEGVELLRAQDVDAPPEVLKRTVEKADGHALTLTLIATYAKNYPTAALDQLGGSDASDIYSRLNEILREYDQNLTANERYALTIASVARRPVSVELISTVGARTWPAATQDGPAFDASSVGRVVERLIELRLLRRAADNHAACHLLVRQYYAQLYEGRLDKKRRLHEQMRDYNRSQCAEREPDTIQGLGSGIEAVYHGCEAGAFDLAAEDLHNLVYFGDARILVNKFGAYDAALENLEQFFPECNLAADPLVSDARNRRWIFHELGLSLMALGRLAPAIPFFEREDAEAERLRDDYYRSTAYQNLTEALTYSGSLAAGVASDDLAIRYAIRARDSWAHCYSLCRKAWAEHLLGHADQARSLYANAEELQMGLDGRHLWSQRGIQFALFLMASGDGQRAREITTANLEYSQSQRFIRTVGQSHRVLGDLDMKVEDFQSAEKHYAEALAIARRASHLPALIEALIARGTWGAVQRMNNCGRADLEEALTYAADGAYTPRDVTLRYVQAGGYRIYEADIRVALMRCFIASGDPAAARAEFHRIERLSTATGYRSAVVSAAALLQRIDDVVT